MKWMIASDLHGTAYYCEKLLPAYHPHQPHRLLQLADHINH